jgi:hypothetical protein
MIDYLISSLIALSVSPIWITIGLSNISTQIYCTFFFIVAVNNKVYLSALTLFIIDLIYNKLIY